MSKKRRTKTTESKVSIQQLPPDVLVKLIRWVSDTSSVFSLLSALDTPTARDLLEPLWQLSLKLEHSTLWPVLHLQRSTLVNSTSHFEAILPLYPHVVNQYVFNLDWLDQHLHPATTMTWQSIPNDDDDDDEQVLPLDEWYRRWSMMFRTTRLELSERHLDHLVAVLPSCHHLLHLSLTNSTCTTTDALCAWLPTSNVIELCLVGLDDGDSLVLFTRVMLQHIHQWLETRPVRLLQLNHCCWEHSDEDVGNFFRSIFHSPTLTSFSLTQCRLPIRFQLPHPFSPTLRKLALRGCQHMTHNHIVAVARALVGSNVTHLCIGRSQIVPDNTSLELVFDALPHTKMLDLDLSGCGLVNIDHLTKFLRTDSHLETLVLDDNPIGDEGAQKIAQAIQSHPTLCNIHVAKCNLAFEGAMALVTLPFKPLKRLLLGRMGKIWGNDWEKLQELAKARNVELNFAACHR
ncbi:Aste57867_9553 [Aphanomyces stellatus]|uniref:Aste57867_9553 protein n=1 Tax=Aphanomyces stellatus TaxID=120398 RepID=A0A485KNA0_9STRA|nr:hypothetical protein As57867_009516 [Aphanomyces stellatus]VFT86432.1 Aste57867_9553 [Aphanomyces stellatus]